MPPIRRSIEDFPASLTDGTTVLIQHGRRKTHTAGNARRNSGEPRAADFTQRLEHRLYYSAGNANLVEARDPLGRRTLHQLRCDRGDDSIARSETARISA